jgi:hypothetical protein
VWVVPNVVPRFGLTINQWLAVAAIPATLVLGACGSDGPSATRPGVTLERVSGDGQSAPPGTALEEPLVARIVDADGRPVRRMDVRWTATAGNVTPTVSTTDANGVAKAMWQLGTASGAQRATATADGLAPIEFVAFVDPNALPDLLTLRAIDLATYDGSGQVVHPDVAFFSPDDGAMVPRLAITPYPWGNANFENPSLFEGNGRDAWSAAAGVTNPVFKPSAGYLSDPDMVSLPDRHELWMFYRHVNDANEILASQSIDGVRWSAPRVVVRAPNHQAVSPTVVRRSPTEWLMWTVNAGEVGCSSASTTVELRRSSDGLTWSSPTTVTLAQSGVFAWHLEVQWVAARSEYWALFNGKVPGSCTTDALYVATSADGLTWTTFRSPVLRRGAIPELADIVYRSTFAYDVDRDLVSLWYSGARFTSRGYEWHAAFERRRRADLFGAVARADAAFLAPSTAPPLTNATAP